MEGSGAATMVGAVLGAIIAAVANVGIGNGVIMTAAFAVSAFVLWVVGSAIISKQKTAAFIEAREKREEQERSNAIRATLEHEEHTAVQQARLAVEALQRMPAILRQIDALTLEAKRCRVDGAFSPFWSAIERAYASAGQYRNRVNCIETASRQHAEAVSSYASRGRDPGPFAQFPVKLNGGMAESAISGRLEELGRIVYDAQKEPTFAMIWEQRRTTSAVVQGFGNLEDAVRGMATSVTSAFVTLSATARQSQVTVTDAMNQLASSSNTANRQQSDTMAALARTAEKVYGETFRQGHGRYPLA